MHVYEKIIERSTNYKGTHPLCLAPQGIQGNNIACRFDIFLERRSVRMFNKSCHLKADLHLHDSMFF